MLVTTQSLALVMVHFGSTTCGAMDQKHTLKTVISLDGEYITATSEKLHR